MPHRDLPTVPALPALPALAVVRGVLTATPWTPPTAGFDAAVLLCLRERQGATELLLGRRVERAGDPWSGHVSLPGGRVEPGDADAVATALRETREEAGIDVARHGRVLGGLDTVVGHVRRARVAPVVAEIMHAVEPVPSAEHRHVWWAAVAALVPALAPVPELPEPVPAYLVTDERGEEHTLWGLTYRILELVREAVADG